MSSHPLNDKSISREELERVLRTAWCAQTSYYPEKWSEDNPAYGQCAATALVVQDILGGEIIWANVELPDGTQESHYFNLADGVEIDLTRSQFPTDTIIPVGRPKTKGFASTRDFILSNENTRKRYEILRQLLASALN